MANLKQIRRRITSVKGTQKITKAMKMVAASKLRKAQNAIVTARPYAYAIRSLIRRLVDESGYQHPLMVAHEEKKTIAVLVLTSDRGLCGGFNSNILRHAYNVMRAKGDRYDIKLLCVGKKAVDYFKHRKVEIQKTFVDVFGDLSYQKADEIARALTKMYIDGEADEIHVVYNEFKSAISQRIVDEQLIPIVSLSDASDNTLTEAVEFAPEHIYEPERKELLNDLVPRHITVQILRCLLESVASEQGARMTAMDSASNNAAEMIEKLNLVYNRTRQAVITNEIMEIVGGAEALDKG